MSSFVDTLKQLGPSRLAIMGGILVGLLLFFVFVSMRVSTPEMKLLYSDLSSADSGAIAAKLEESQVRYEVSPDGGRIMVSEDEVGRARLLLAEAGLPNGGSLGYEIFDKQSGFGTTNFVQNINQVRALEGELARTISSLSSVRSARVHLVLPQRELFSRESRPSSASVYLGVRPGAIVEREQILSIQSLIASAVPDLKADNVTIIDSNGNLLAKGGEDNRENMLSVKAEEMRRNYESRLTEKIEDQVSRIVGYGNVRAIVTAEVNFDRISTNEEVFDPEGQVVRSSQVTEENNTERDPAPEDISVQNNLPGVGGDLLSDTAPTAENSRLEEVTNFEISRTVRNTVREVGEVNRLSIGVLVDGRYITNEEGERVYEERSEEELAEIEELVRSAAGYNEDRGDVITVKNLQFAEIDTNEEAIDESMLFGFQKSDLIDAAEVVLVGIMIILVILLILQPMVSRLLAVSDTELDEDLEADLLTMRPAAPALEGPDAIGAFGGGQGDEEESLIDIQGVEGKVKSSSIRKVEEIVENYPNETVSVIRSWMTQES
ncbi:MAG TPA: flagellar basal-body MS-ring/collar protein FliF [Alphaproteobacteria bacterium]|nr:flagellar M-ring protein FliF [Alphaproteobacteria bacterium]USO04674.1 MAG: flagellar M-ring protein FliF [Rhodospirillales bacterium]HOO82128.1 flagellar basal-body MS-ring/collar protein FliF [Alphaproteobacteria bacterium]